MDDSNDNLMSDSEEVSDGSLAKRTKKQTKAAKAVDSDDENDSDEDYRTKTTVVSSGPVHSTPSHRENCSENEEDMSASFANESNDGPPPPFSAPVEEYQLPKPAAVTPASTVRVVSTWQNPLQSTAKKSDSSESSIASQSDDFAQSIEDDEASEPATEPMATKSEPAPAYGEASESGFYEEEAFDEESVTPEPISTPAPIVRADPVLPDTTKSEPNFDYSMDFSDDDVEANSMQAKEPIASTALEHHSEEEASKSQSLDGNSEHEQSEFLESDDEAPNDRDQTEDDGNTIPDEEQEIPSSDAIPGTEMPEDTGNYELHAEQQEKLEQLAPARQTDISRAASTAAGATAALGPTDRVKPLAFGVPTRQRVVIVREYEQMDGEKPEMKDASTQFTGNHAGIQAELVPEGMHNLFPRSSIPTEQQQQQSQPDPNAAPASSNSSPTGPTSSSTLPPPPPQMTTPAQSAENCGYSMDPIHSYSMSSTSVYKQQLLDLQRQIQLKKQETEKLVRDRMAFQYSSFRGTERV